MKKLWIRIPVFLFLLFAISFVCFLPVVAFFPENFHPREAADNSELITDTKIELITNLAFFVAMISSVSIMVRGLEEKSLASVKLNFDYRGLVIGFLGSSILITLLAFLLWLYGFTTFTYVGFSHALSIGFLLHFLVSLSEEILFRAYLLNTLEEKLKTPWAILWSSLAFGAVHLANDHVTWVGILNIFLSGVLMGIVTAKSMSISSAIGLHWGWNFMQGPVMGFNVSGHLSPGLFSANSTDNHLLSGGDFGAEGSILLVPITIFACWLASSQTRKEHAN